MAETTSQPVEMRARGVGELLDLTFSLYRRNFWTFIVITVVVMGPLMALTMIANSTSIVQMFAPVGASDLSDAAANEMMSALLGASLVSMCACGLVVVVGALAPWMGGALTHNVIERVLGRAPSWRDSYRATLPRWGALWVANAIRVVVLYACLIPLGAGLYGLLFALLISAGVGANDAPSGLAMAAGLSAICLPLVVVGLALALWLGVGWSLSEPAIIGEGADAIQSIGRSYSLTKGMRWQLLGRLLLLGVMEFVIIQLPLYGLTLLVFAGSAAAVQGGDASSLSVAGFIGSLIFGVVGNVLVVPLNVIYVTVNYLDVRVRKEQLDLQLKAAQLAPVGAPAEAGIQPAPAAEVIGSSAPSTQPAPAMASPIQPPAVPVAPATYTPPPVAPSPADLAPIDPSIPPGQRISLLFGRIRAQGASASLLNELGLAYQQIGDFDGALDAMSRARLMAPYDPDIAYNLALLFRDRNNVAEARRMMGEYLRLERDPAERQRVLDNPRLQSLLPPR